MRVTLKREEETAGFFRNKTVFRVRFSVQMTEEEIAIAKHRGIADHVLYELTEIEPPIPFYVRDFFKGKEQAPVFSTFAAANEFEALLKQQLVMLKDHLAAPSSAGKVETFEL